MSKAYPIWNKVTNCTYQGDKSYGNKETGEVNIYVGENGLGKTRNSLIPHAPAWLIKFAVSFISSLIDTSIFNPLSQCTVLTNSHTRGNRSFFVYPQF